MSTSGGFVIGAAFGVVIALVGWFIYRMGR